MTSDNLQNGDKQMMSNNSQNITRQNAISDGWEVCLLAEFGDGDPEEYTETATQLASMLASFSLEEHDDENHCRYVRAREIASKWLEGATGVIDVESLTSKGSKDSSLIERIYHGHLQYA